MDKCVRKEMDRCVGKEKTDEKRMIWIVWVKVLCLYVCLSACLAVGSSLLLCG